MDNNCDCKQIFNENSWYKKWIRNRDKLHKSNASWFALRRGHGILGIEFGKFGGNFQGVTKEVGCWSIWGIDGVGYKVSYWSGSPGRVILGCLAAGRTAANPKAKGDRGVRRMRLSYSPFFPARRGNSQSPGARNTLHARGVVKTFSRGMNKKKYEETRRARGRALALIFLPWKIDEFTCAQSHNVLINFFSFATLTGASRPGNISTYVILTNIIPPSLETQTRLSGLFNRW